jgi:hypothetical protein
MKTTLLRRLILSLGLLSFSVASALTEVPADAADNSADEYFTQRQAVRKTRFKSASDHLLSLHVGGFYDDQSYKWGARPEPEVGHLSAGFTYLVGQWVGSSDVSLRVDFSNYRLDGGKSNKMALVPVVTFPRASAGFPLYFGGGLGPGVFFRQLRGESSLALDYTLFAGLRFLDVFDRVGFFSEVGWKNHFHILSDGQFNGSFISLGTSFAF